MRAVGSSGAAELSHFFRPVRFRRAGHDGRAVARERRVVDERAPRRPFVGRHLDHVQPDVAQRSHVVLVLSLGPVVVERRSPGPHRPGRSAHDGVRVTRAGHASAVCVCARVRLSVPATGRRNDQRTPDGPRPYATRRRVATFREPRARLVDGVLCVRARRCPWSRGSGCARGSGAKLPTVRRRHCARRVFGPRGRPADVRGGLGGSFRFRDKSDTDTGRHRRD